MRINSFVKKSMTTKGSYCTINLILDLDFHMDKAFNSSIDHLNNILFDYEEDQPGKQIVNGADFADTYHKQVLSIILNPSLLQSKDIMEEAKIKAQSYLKIPNFSIGAYSDSKGLLYTRKKISEWYYRRDGYKINEDDLYLTNGGNNAYEHAINLITNPGDSILLPNPCYPFYINLNNSIKLENIFYDVQNGINVITYNQPLVR